MLQPRIFLLMLAGTVGIVVVIEMGFENKLAGGGFTQSIRPISGRDAVPTAALNSNRSSHDILKGLLAKSFEYNNRSSPATFADVATNIFTSQKCLHCSHAKAVTTPVTHPSTAHVVKPTTPPLPVSNKTKWDGKQTSLINPAKAIGDRLMLVNSQHGVSVSRERMDKMLHPILGMPVVKKESVLRVLVVTYFRAGSTFLGDILQQNWKTFYHFEPLHTMSFALRIGETQSHDALEFLSRLFRCDLSNSTSYVEWASKTKNQFLFRHNHFLWATCRLKIKSCFTPEYISEVCRRAPFQVMKLTRVHMHHVEQFLRDNRDLNVKVVYLVRDPRGIISSRKVLEWCNNTGCMDPKELCLEMQHDLEIFQNMRQEYGERISQVRYEDLALNSSVESKALFKALGMPFTSVVERFIKSHTQARAEEINNPYSTRRNSSITAFEWRHKLSFKDIEAIQKECSGVMDSLGYKKFESQKYQLDGSFPIIVRNT